MISFCILCFLFNIVIFSNGNIVSIDTKLGTVVGTQVQTTFFNKTGKVNMFRGIPYAEPPVGGYRFIKPVRRKHYSDPINATVFSPACPQDLSMMMGWVPGFPYVGDDCLTVNVFVPADHVSNKDSRAVMVYIYGGAFVIGQSKIYSAENLTMMGDVIVVTFNYRVSSLGFLSTGSSKYRGNMGLWDQKLAIKWVHDNIADYGGDPNKVLLFGESAGGAAVLLQALHPDNKGMFQRILSESGSPLCPWAIQTEPLKYARRLADNLGCNDTDLDKAIDCVAKLDSMTIINASRVGTQDETVFRSEWDVVVDGEFVSGNWWEMFHGSDDTFKGLDYLVGMNKDDGAFLGILAFQPYYTQQTNKSLATGLEQSFFENFYVPLFLRDRYGKNVIKLFQDWVAHEYINWDNVNDPVSMREKFIEFSGDYNYFMPLIETLKVHSEQPRSKAYLFEFKLRPSYTNSPKWIDSTNHGEELPFVFGFPYTMANGMNFHDHVEPYELSTSWNMMTMWSNFAKTGDPNCPEPISGPRWPVYQQTSRKYLQFTKSGTIVKNNLYGRRQNFWLDLLPELRQQMNIPIIG